VTLLHPRTDTRRVAEEVTGDAEALIREARHLRRRRWAVGLLVVAVVGAGLGWALAAAAHGPSTPAPRVPPHRLISRDVSPGLPVGPYANLTVAGPLAVAPGGALYIADVNREQVLVRLPNGRFRVVAGDGKKGVSGDGGPAIDAEFLDIVDMAVGPDGSLYVVDGDRVREVSPNGVISTVAGIPGMSTPPPCCGPITLPPPIANGTPARSVSIDVMNSAAIALSEQGMLYISTGMQLLRLDAGTLDVIATRAIGPPYDGQPFNSPGQIAVDAQGNLDVSGGNGWAIWQVAPNGVATEVAAPNARRSGGNTSVLERAPDGVVYGESGSTFLKLQGHRATVGYSFPDTDRSYFWLTYFAFGPGGTIYADEIPGGSAFDKYQQLRVVRDDRSSVLWQQTPADVVQVAP
jgi:serine/threonine-protein kinase